MTLLEYYASIRKDLLFAITGVEDSSYGLGWDDATPNSATRETLKGILRQYVREARRFGLYVVTRHCDCPNPRHEGYPVENLYGLSIVYKDDNYIWTGGDLYQGKRFCNCPCVSNNDMSDHWVIDDVIYDKNVDQEICRALESVLTDISIAIEKSGDGRSRSAIREFLLKAIIEINDKILPVPMDDYIKHCLNIAGKQDNS